MVVGRFPGEIKKIVFPIFHPHFGPWSHWSGLGCAELGTARLGSARLGSAQVGAAGSARLGSALLGGGRGGGGTKAGWPDLSRGEESDKNNGTYARGTGVGDEDGHSFDFRGVAFSR